MSLWCSIFYWILKPREFLRTSNNSILFLAVKLINFINFPGFFLYQIIFAKNSDLLNFLNIWTKWMQTLTMKRKYLSKIRKTYKVRIYRRWVFMLWKYHVGMCWLQSTFSLAWDIETFSWECTSRLSDINLKLTLILWKNTEMRIQTKW